MDERVEHTEAGAIVYDRTLIDRISDADFEPDSWSSCRTVAGSLRSGGRGATRIVSDGTAEFVLRHYRRGGLVARFNRDRYLWLGEDRTRAFAEWRLLAKLRTLGLPVPAPAAARYRRAGLWYTADLLTVRVHGIRSLADRLIVDTTDRRFWQGIGRGIRRFHDAGACHADLNAYNVQVDTDDRVLLLDFDRGRLRPPGRWQEQNLARLHRSLRKISALAPCTGFTNEQWAQLRQGYSG